MQSKSEIRIAGVAERPNVSMQFILHEMILAD